MKLNSIKLVTIIAPKDLKGELIALFKSAGISGYTYFEAFGKGAGQLWDQNTRETDNLQFKVLVPILIAHTLMQTIAEKYFGKHKVIVFEQDANVIRYEKFEKVVYGKK